MIKVLVRFIVVLTFFSFSLTAIPSANAILGLGTCEKVKKEIQALENSFNQDQIGWAKYRNSLLPANLEYKYKVYMSNDQIYPIWKVAYNNPKCFSRTQNLQIKKLQSQQMSDYIDDMPRSEYKTTDPKCIKLINQLKNLQYCTIRTGIYINNVYSMNSIYKY